MPNNIIQLNELRTRKRMNSPVPEGMNERKPVRDTDTDTTAASSPPQPEK